MFCGVVLPEIDKLWLTDHKWSQSGEPTLVTNSVTFAEKRLSYGY